MKKKYLAIATSTAMISGMMLGSAFAANRVEVKVTSEPIQSRSVCDKVGGFSLEFDNGTELRDGDRITIDTDYVTATNLTSLCRSVDMMIAPDGTGGLTPADTDNAWDVANTEIPAAGIASPVNYVAAAPVAALGGVNFHVYGSQGGQRIAVDVIGEQTGATLTVPIASVDNKLTVKFLDQRTNTQFVNDGIWVKPNSAADQYSEEAELADNTLCLNVSSWDGSVVKASLDSATDKFTFIPSDPQIAHIVAPEAYTVETCKNPNCGNIPIGTLAVTQQSSSNSCDSFTDEPADGYCKQGTDLHANNDLIIQKSSGSFAIDAYQVTMEILVNGVAGDQGVYFAGNPSSTAGTDKTALCGETSSSGFTDTTHYNASGAEVSTGSQTNCGVDAANRSVKLVSSGNLGMTGSQNLVKLTLPEMIYDAVGSQAVTDGDSVTVRVTLDRAPCGNILTTDHCVGNLVASCPTTPATYSKTITYPYFTEGNTDGFWDGIALTNTTTSAGTVTLTMYEADGDIATATVPVAARSLYVNTIETMIANGDFTLATVVEGTLGNARSYIVATSNTLSLDGFAMMGNNGTGVSMGYLPRTYEH